MTEIHFPFNYEKTSLLTETKTASKAAVVTVAIDSQSKKIVVNMCHYDEVNAENSPVILATSTITLSGQDFLDFVYSEPYIALETNLLSRLSG